MAVLSERLLLPAEQAVYSGGPAPQHRTLRDIFHETVRTYPDAFALDDGNDRLTYAQLMQRMHHRVHEMRIMGLGVGSRIGICLPSGTNELYVAILSAIEIGAAYVPVDFEESSARREQILSEARIDATIEPQGVIRQRPLDQSDKDERELNTAHDAWIIFTSGSTGKPKGVAVSHRSAASLVDTEHHLFCRERPLGPKDRVLAGLSVGFDASCEEMWLAWRSGACLVPIRRSVIRSGPDLGAEIAARSITALSTVPSIAAQLDPRHLAGVRLLIFGGESCPAELVRRIGAPDREIWNTYGPTETTVIATAARVSGNSAVSIGLPIEGVKCAVVNHDGIPVPFGESGELVISGSGVARYLDHARDTEAFRPVASLGWQRAYYTGDFVRAAEDGLYFLGRNDDQIKIAGRRVELGEIEAACASIPGVLTAAATIRGDRSTSPLVVCYLVVDRQYNETLARERIHSLIPVGISPILATLDALPIAPSGKVDRKALPWPLADETLSFSNEEAYLRELASIWQQILGPVPLHRESNFFASGGTSIAAAELIATLRRQYPSCSVADIYHYPTVASFADRLTASQAQNEPVQDPSSRARGTGTVQTIATVALYAYSSIPWLGLFVLVNSLLSNRLLGSNWSPIALVAIGVFALTPFGRLLTGAGIIRLLTHAIHEGRYKKGGGIHLRIWAAEQIMAISGAATTLGTPWAIRFARLAGSSVGANVQLYSLPPVTGLIDIDDNVSIESGVDLSAWMIEGNTIIIGSIGIGEGAHIGARSTLNPGTRIQRRAHVERGAVVTGEVGESQDVHGSPAVPVTGERSKALTSQIHAKRRWRAAYLLGPMLTSMVQGIAFTPAILLFLFEHPRHVTLLKSIWWMARFTPAIVALSLITYALLVAFTIRFCARYATAGVHPIASSGGFASWAIERLLEQSRQVLYLVYASIFTSAWLRMIGVTVGRGVECSTISGQLHLLTLQDGSFLADDVLIGPRTIRDGYCAIDHVVVGERAFVGNSAIVAPGRHVPANSLIGVYSSVPENARQGAAYFGLPPFEFPRPSAPSAETRTFKPLVRLRIARTLVEALRIIPIIVSLVLADGVFASLSFIDTHFGTIVLLTSTGVLLLLAAAFAGLITACAKWVIIGRIRPAEHPLWSLFVWRNELAWAFVEELAMPWIAPEVMGTPLLNNFLRLLGARIGRRVWCETHWLDDPDLIEIGDDAVISHGSDLQTHLFHDRVMQLDEIRVGTRSSIGAHSFLLPGSQTGAETYVRPGSLIPRKESLPAKARWGGNLIAP